MKCKCCMRTSEMKDIVLIDGICNECVEFEKIKMY